ncbi:MAG: glycoside hydrolase [Bacteroidales bacterium]|nr:glycoside hydrolase [Bacteroidales bacterium]
MKKQIILVVLSLLACFVTLVSANEPRIDWDPNTLTLIAKGGGYGRMIRLQSGLLLACYQQGGAIWVARSVDGGYRWQSQTRVATYAYGNPANPELLQLQDGTVICFYNERPTDGKHAYTIMMVRSDPRLYVWSKPQQLYAAGTTFENGCWEPAAIQLTTGEVQLFFANESPYRQSNEQEISLLRSWDGGHSWSDYETVSMRLKRRDGMPVPLILAEERGLVLAIEDNGFVGRMKPVIVYSSLYDIWEGGGIPGSSAQRWGAMRETLPEMVYAGAPYIRQMPSGHTILSFQTEWVDREEYQMAVCVGDAWARDFGEPSYPFDLPSEVSGLWNSLCVKDANTITAISGTKIGGVRGLWAIDGHFNPGSETASDVPIVSIWRHQVAQQPDTWLRFYANGFLDSPSGPATWTRDENTLSLRRPNPLSRRQSTIQQVTLAEDLRSYTGQSHAGEAIRGDLSQSLAPDPFEFPKKTVE